MVLYLLVGISFGEILIRRRWIAFWVFMLFAGYYLIVPGILPLPRFHLCVLPYFSLLAARGLWLLGYYRKEIKRRKIPELPGEMEIQDAGKFLKY